MSSITRIKFCACGCYCFSLTRRCRVHLLHLSNAVCFGLIDQTKEKNHIAFISVLCCHVRNCILTKQRVNQPASQPISWLIWNIAPRVTCWYHCVFFFFILVHLLCVCVYARLLTVFQMINRNGNSTHTHPHTVYVCRKEYILYGEYAVEIGLCQTMESKIYGMVKM